MTDNAVHDKDNSLWDIGIDWLSTYNSTQHTMGIVFIRCADISPRDKGKEWNQKVVAIIPGPKQPEVLLPYLSPMLSELETLASEGIKVSGQVHTTAVLLPAHTGGATTLASFLVCTVKPWGWLGAPKHIIIPG